MEEMFKDVRTKLMMIVNEQFTNKQTKEKTLEFVLTAPDEELYRYIELYDIENIKDVNSNIKYTVYKNGKEVGNVYADCISSATFKAERMYR